MCAEAEEELQVLGASITDAQVQLPILQQRQLDISNTRRASHAIAKAPCLSDTMVDVAVCSSGSWIIK